MCSPFDVETVDMKNINTSDVVADIESARAKRLFNNFINRPEAREEYMTALHVMAEQGVTPGYLRYLMQYSYQEAVKDCQQQSREAVLPAVRDGSDSGQFLSTEL